MVSWLFQHSVVLDRRVGVARRKAKPWVAAGREEKVGINLLVEGFVTTQVKEPLAAQKVCPQISRIFTDSEGVHESRSRSASGPMNSFVFLFHQIDHLGLLLLC